MKEEVRSSELNRRLPRGCPLVACLASLIGLVGFPVGQMLRIADGQSVAMPLAALTIMCVAGLGIAILTWSAWKQ